MASSGRFPGVTVTLVDAGARTIALPSSSIIGLCDTFTVLPTASAKPNELTLITSEREAVAVWGEDSAITRACKAIFVRAKAVVIGCGVAKVEGPAQQTSAIIGGFLASRQRAGMQALLDGKNPLQRTAAAADCPGSHRDAGGCYQSRQANSGICALLKLRGTQAGIILSRL
jgi:phage tail sheath protein FI